MSNYIKVLKRLQDERRTEPAPARTAPDAGGAAEAVGRKTAAGTLPATGPLAGARPLPTPRTAEARLVPSGIPVSAPAPAIAWPRQHWEAPEGTPAPETDRGIATLLDSLRVLATGQPARVVVFAAASTAEAVGLVTAGLARHAARYGMRVLAAELVLAEGRALLLPQSGTATPETPLEVDLAGGPAADALRGWIERSAPGADLVIITGPSLAESIDAALLACACDGLVIVAEAEVTERAALQAAAERARVAGCRILGVVMRGARDRLPSWMRRLVEGASTGAAQREGRQ